jgi:hypothetical protein
MTPSAITPAGRAASDKSGSATDVRARAASARSARTAVPGHRRKPRPRSAPKAPRRVSGPVRARPAAHRPPRTRNETRRAPSRRSARPLGARAVAFARSLPDHPVLDRLIRGRAWIPVLGVLLVGIVAMQVEVLKLGTSIGRSIERGSMLQGENDQLRMTVAALGGDQRIERLAAARGMIMPAPAAVGFLSSPSGASVQRALANIHAPDAVGFMSQTTSNGGVASLAGTQAASSGTSTGATTASSAQATSSAVPAAPAVPAVPAAPAVPAVPAAPVGAVQSQSSSSGAGSPVGGG